MISLNSTYVENSAGEVGGAIFAEYGQVILSTFLDNTAAGDIGSNAIFVFDPEETTSLAGNIFAGAPGTAQVGEDTADSYVDLGGNVFSTSAATEIAIDPAHPSTRFDASVTSLFGAGGGLGDNGGPTQTVALVAGSPAIDAVPAEVLLDFAPTTLEAASANLTPADALQAASDSTDLDQRGTERTGLVDAGSFEFGDAELAATGSDPIATGWLAGIATLLLGGGAVALFVSRRSARTRR